MGVAPFFTLWYPFPFVRYKSLSEANPKRAISWKTSAILVVKNIVKNNFKKIRNLKVDVPKIPIWPYLYQVGTRRFLFSIFSKDHAFFHTFYWMTSLGLKWFSHNLEFFFGVLFLMFKSLSHFFNVSFWLMGKGYFGSFDSRHAKHFIFPTISPNPHTVFLTCFLENKCIKSLFNFLITWFITIIDSMTFIWGILCLCQNQSKITISFTWYIF